MGCVKGRARGPPSRASHHWDPPPPTRLAAAGWRINTFDVNWRGETDQAAEVAAIRTPSQEMREHGVGAVAQSSVLLGGGGIIYSQI